MYIGGTPMPPTLTGKMFVFLLAHPPTRTNPPESVSDLGPLQPAEGAKPREGAESQEIDRGTGDGRLLGARE
jgi:hypothetical protein